MSSTKRRTCRTPYPGGTCGCGCGCDSLEDGETGNCTCPECAPVTDTEEEGEPPKVMGGLDYLTMKTERCDRCGEPEYKHNGVERFCPFYSTYRPSSSVPPVSEPPVGISQDMVSTQTEQYNAPAPGLTGPVLGALPVPPVSEPPRCEGCGKKAYGKTNERPPRWYCFECFYVRKKAEPPYPLDESDVESDLDIRAEMHRLGLEMAARNAPVSEAPNLGEINSPLTVVDGILSRATDTEECIEECIREVMREADQLSVEDDAIRAKYGILDATDTEETGEPNDALRVAFLRGVEYAIGSRSRIASHHADAASDYAASVSKPPAASVSGEGSGEREEERGSDDSIVMPALSRLAAERVVDLYDEEQCRTVSEAEAITRRASVEFHRRRRAIAAGRVPADPGQTHYENCWRERGHHGCAIARVETFSRAIRFALLGRIDEAKALL